MSPTWTSGHNTNSGANGSAHLEDDVACELPEAVQGALSLIGLIEVGDEGPICASIEGEVLAVGIREAAEVVKPGADGHIAESGLLGAHLHDVGHNRAPVHRAGS